LFVAAVALALVVPLVYVDMAFASEASSAPPETVSEKLEGLPAESGTEEDEGLQEKVEGTPDDSSADDRPSGGVNGQEAQRDGDVVQRSEPTATPIPFTTLGFKVPTGATVWFRTSDDGDDWTEWQEAELLDIEDGPDPDSEEAARAEDPLHMTDAIWVGEAQWLQTAVRGGDPEDLEVHVIDTEGLHQSFGQRLLDAVGNFFSGRLSPAHASSGPRGVVTRSQWGADESWRKSGPSYASNVRAVVVHHTAGSNTYTRAQAPGVVRGIYHWHAIGLGWNDIGYNMLVDRYGTMYEGRYGGLDRAVTGAHAAGYNTGTFGISVMGNFDVAHVPAAAFDSVARAIGWKAAIHGINLSGTARVNNRTISTLIGHRDVGSTACPGRYFYPRLGELRNSATTYMLDMSGVSSGAIQIAGDWNGNGQATPGWYYKGRFYLRNSLSSGPADIVFGYGRTGDVPIVGDWNGNGRDTIGILRDGDWHLRFTNTSGAADLTFRYGRLNSGDYALAGDWNGDGRTTVGIVRDGEWHLRNENRGGVADIEFRYGRILDGDVPVVGDWTGDGIDTPGIRRGAEWHLRHQNRGGVADQTFNYGVSSDAPVVGDWNNNGQTTIGIVRGPEWHLRNENRGGSSNNSLFFIAY
jgi:hypothetical protein